MRLIEVHRRWDFLVRLLTAPSELSFEPGLLVNDHLVVNVIIRAHFSLESVVLVALLVLLGKYCVRKVCAWFVDHVHVALVLAHFDRGDWGLNVDAPGCVFVHIFSEELVA